MLPLPKRGGKGGEGEGSRPMPIIFAESDHVTWNLHLHTKELNSSPDVGFVHPIPSHILRSGLVCIQKYAIPQYRSYYTLGRAACCLRPAVPKVWYVIIAPQKYVASISWLWGATSLEWGNWGDPIPSHVAEKNNVGQEARVHDMRRPYDHSSILGGPARRGGRNSLF